MACCSQLVVHDGLLFTTSGTTSQLNASNIAVQYEQHVSSIRSTCQLHTINISASYEQHLSSIRATSQLHTSNIAVPSVNLVAVTTRKDQHTCTGRLLRGLGAREVQQQAAAEVHQLQVLVSTLQHVVVTLLCSKCITDLCASMWWSHSCEVSALHC